MKQQVMKAGNLLATAYMLIMFVLYPFYMKNGYADLGEAKYHFFFYVTTAAVILLLALAGVTLLISNCVYPSVRLTRHTSVSVWFSAGTSKPESRRQKLPPAIRMFCPAILNISAIIALLCRF